VNAYRSIVCLLRAGGAAAVGNKLLHQGRQFVNALGQRVVQVLGFTKIVGQVV